MRAVERVQRSIYGEDNRHDLFELPAGANRDDADSLVAIVRTNFMTDNGDDTTTLTTSNFGTSENLCPGQRFSSQPTVGPGIKCSGFLVSADVIATAGRCIYTNADLSGLRFVFGFRMRDAVEAQTVINNVTSIAV